MNKKPAKLEVITDFSLLSETQKKWLKQNNANGKQIIAMVSGKKLISAISYSVVSPIECLINYMGSTKISVQTPRINPEEYLLELLVCKGIRIFDCNKVRAQHSEMLNQWNKKGLIEYSIDWKFQITKEGRQQIKQKTHNTPIKIASTTKPVKSGLKLRQPPKTTNKTSF